MNRLLRGVRRYGVQAVLVVAIAFCGVTAGVYVVVSQTVRPRLPWQATPFTIRAAFANVRGVQPGTGQAVEIAGVQVGTIGNVTLHEGQAIVSLQIDPQHAHLIGRDATALLRPHTVLKDMFVSLDPGDPKSSGRMPAGGLIPAGRTLPDVNPDEINATLDADTRDYLRALVVGLGVAFNGSGASLNRVFKALGPTNRSLAEVSAAFGANRLLLAKLVHETRIISDALASQGGSLRAFVTGNASLLSATAQQGREISQALGELPETLDHVTTSLQATAAYSRVAGPVYHALIPSARTQNAANHALATLALDGTPLLAHTIRPFVRQTRPFLRTLTGAARLGNQASSNLNRALISAGRFLNMLAYNPSAPSTIHVNRGHDAGTDRSYLFWLAWLGQLTNSVFSVSDATGAFRRVEALVDCSSVRALVANQPAVEPVLALTSLLDDPGVCPSDQR